jgi:hypothetical protein
MGYSAQPQYDIFSNLLKECEDSEFWQNFKKAAPILLCKSIEHDQAMKTARDMSFVEEMLKSKTIFKKMSEKFTAGDADIDIVEYSLATKMLENKLSILEGMNYIVDGESEDTVTLNI